jgi:hypothetical protein
MTKAICYNKTTGELYGSGANAWAFYRMHYESGEYPDIFCHDWCEDLGWDYQRLLNDPGYRIGLYRYLKEYGKRKRYERLMKEAGLHY